MATIKSYTDLEQSKKLAEILPLESADWTILNCFNEFGEKDGSNIRVVKEVNTLNDSIEKIPCWSLASLLEQLPYEVCDDDGNSSYLQMDKEDDVYQLVYTDPYRDFESIETDRYEHFVDACYEMIIKSHELKML